VREGEGAETGVGDMFEGVQVGRREDGTKTDNGKAAKKEEEEKGNQTKEVL